MKIAIMGTSVSSGNRGVHALGASLVNLCLQASPGGEVVLLLSHRDNRPAAFRVRGQRLLVPVVPCRLSPRACLSDHLFWILLLSALYRFVPVKGVRAAFVRSTPWIKAIVESDVTGDVRGGDSFSDIYGMKKFMLGFFMAWSVLLVKGTMVQFPQTYGPYKSRVARWLARYILKRSRVIIARDKESQRVAQALAGPSREVLLSPDVAFSLEAVPPERIEMEPSLAGPVPSGIIGLNINGLMYNGGYTRQNMFGLKLDYAAFLAGLVGALLANHPGELWLVPHTYAPRGRVESDNEADEKLRACLTPDLRSRVRLVTAAYDQHEIKGVIGQCDFFIGSRMHACIAALSQGIPCVGVAYSRKFEGVFESVGMAEWVVDARSASGDEAVTRIISLYQQRDDVRSGLIHRADLARQQLADVFRNLFDKHLESHAV